MGAFGNYRETKLRLKIQECTPTLVLGKVCSSYSEATTTQEIPRNQCKQTRKQTHKDSARTTQGIYHRLNRRTRLNCVG